MTEYVIDATPLAAPLSESRPRAASAIYSQMETGKPDLLIQMFVSLSQHAISKHIFFTNKHETYALT